MPKEEWGVKRVCPTTGKRFYDLGKSPVISPYTGEVVNIDVPGRKGSSPAPSAAKAKAKPAKEADTDDVLIDDDDEAVTDDADLLDDDDDDDTVSLDELNDVADGDDD